jgi:6-pyruvoyl-tetrahydropterin synthase
VNSTLFVDQLTVIDCTYFDEERGLVGESWIVDLELGGQLDEQSMMMDFGLIKKQVKNAIDSSIDHTLVVPADSENVSIEEVDEMLTVQMHLNSGEVITHTSPREAVYRLPSKSVTIAAVEIEVKKIVAQHVQQNVQNVHLTLRVEEGDEPYYHYTHGLKKHQGNCQRIAHGHRSKLRMWINSNKNSELEGEVVELWKDIYIGTEEDVIAQYGSGDEAYVQFSYTAQEGRFDLVIPQKFCYIIPTDSTVECIAHYLASLAKKAFPNDEVKVQAFEGVQKGAISVIQ